MPLLSVVFDNEDMIPCIFRMSSSICIIIYPQIFSLIESLLSTPQKFQGLQIEKYAPQTSRSYILRKIVLNEYKNSLQV